MPVVTQVYFEQGMAIESDSLKVDLSTPRTIHVEGINEKTGQKKDYLLKVTQSGKLLLI